MQRLVGQVHLAAVNIRRLLPGIDLHPLDLALAAIGFVDGSVDDLEHHRRHVDANPVAFDKRDDRAIRHVQRMVGVGSDCLTVGGHLDVVVMHELSRLRGRALYPSAEPSRQRV